MSATTIDMARDTYVTGLRNQHAVEEQAVNLLTRQVERLEHYPELEARMRQHIDETKRQQERLEQLLAEFGSSESSLKDTMMGFMGNMAALVHTAAQDEVMKNSLANFAFENFEIAAYKSLLTLADLTGHSGAVPALRQSLNEEEEMALFLDTNLDAVTRKYVALQTRR